MNGISPALPPGVGQLLSDYESRREKVLRDFPAGGMGYNFGSDASYYLIGFRLPFAAAPLPVFNKVENDLNE